MQYAHPIGYQATLESIDWARMEAKENPQNIAIMTLNHNDWTPHEISMRKHQDIYIVAIIPPNNHVYPTIPSWPSYYNQHETIFTTIICIHSLDTPPTPSLNDTKLTSWTNGKNIWHTIGHTTSYNNTPPLTHTKLSRTKPPHIHPHTKHLHNSSFVLPYGKGMET